MRARTVLQIAAVCGLAATAWGQNALDRNLQRGSGGVNQSRPDFASELRFRNAVVTGNAPGGMSFRGNVGYTAPGEFFGTLGSNDNFAFRRDTVYSGMAGLGIRGTDALQYQFALTTGNRPPSGFGGIDGGAVVRRSGAGTTGAVVTGESGYRSPVAGVVPGAFTPGSESQDVLRGYGSEMLPLRSPSAYISSRGLQPTLLGRMLDQQGQQVGVTASGLRGISLSPLGARDQQLETANPTQRQGQVQLDRGVPQRPETPGQERQARAAEQRNDPTSLQGMSNQQALSGPDPRLDTRLATSVDNRRTPYDDLVARMREQAARTAAPGTEPQPSDLDRRLAELREQLAERAEGTPGTKPIEPTRPEGQQGEQAQPGERPAKGREGEGKPREFRPETIEMLRHGGEVTTLAPEGFDAYSTAMKTAQQYLGAGRYFDAEARFTTALGAKPGDPMAAAGRVHAELGAGMFLSAALNLRTLLSQNPEVTGVKYAADLLPAAERLPAIKTRLRELMADAKGSDPDLGLLLGYVGYQTGDREAVQHGLDAMGTVQGAEQATSRRLAEMLRQVWLAPANATGAVRGANAPGPAAPSPQPAPQAPPPPPPVAPK
jgi:hypothetical protein